MNDLDDPFDEEDDDASASTYLTFRVGPAEYALPVLLVTEIVRLPPFFALPDVPDHVCGVVNLRGRVVPLMDLRRRFGLPQQATTDRTVVVVAEVDQASTGLIVDGVADVVVLTELDTTTVQAGVGRSQLVQAVARRGEQVCFVLDPAALLAPMERTPSAPTLPPTSPSPSGLSALSA